MSMVHPGRVFTVGAVLKALFFGPVAAVGASSPFWALTLVVVSACLTGMWGLLQTIVQGRQNRELHDRLDRIENRQVDMAGAVGMGKRRADIPPAAPPVPTPKPPTS